jgi:signal transduction histidine kinase
MALRFLGRGLVLVVLAAGASFGRPPGAVAQPAAQPAARTVVTIHGGSETFPGNGALDAAIRETLQSDPALPVDYYAEYLENEEFASDTADAALRDYVRKKFDERRIDLVIANTVPALQFVIRYRDELFPSAPVVFLAAAPPASLLRDQKGITGIVRDASHSETLALALRLHPSTARVFVVGYAPHVDGFQDRIRASFSTFAKRVSLTYATQPALTGLLDEIRRLPPDSLIFFLRYSPHAPGHAVNVEDPLPAIVAASPVPVYGGVESNLGKGVVGGMVRTSAASGRRIGEIALRILAGTPAEQIPVESVSVSPMFDWRALQRWGIDESRLPLRSELLFRTPTAWEAYRPYFIAIGIILGAQLILIGTLLTQVARRRRAEADVRAREAALRTTYQRTKQLAGRLINAQEAARAEIARDLHDDLCQKLVAVSAGVTSLKLSKGAIQDPPSQEAISDLERETLGAFESVRRLSHDLHPATLRLLGLAPALKSHCAEIAKRHGVQVAFDAGPGIGFVFTEVAVCLFRIAQESLRNSISHGRARRIDVTLERAGDWLELTISDDGCGFDVEALRGRGEGLGLVAMEERAHVVGGDVRVTSEPGRGTTVVVRSPAATPAEPAEPPAPAAVSH